MSELQSVPPAAGPQDVPGLFAAERQCLLELLDGLAPADWLLPTPCPGWTVVDLCRHLVGDDLSALSWHRDGHRGTEPPAGPDDAAFVDWLDELQRVWVFAARRVSPRLALDLLAWTGPQVVETFRQADPRARTAHVSWAGPDPVPVWLDQVRELSEFWIHRQQLLTALGRPAGSDLDEEPVLGVILDGFRWAYPFRLTEAGVGRPGDTVVIDVTSRAWTLVAGDDGRWGFGAGAGRELARLAMSADVAWRLLSNNLEPARQRDLNASGAAAAVNALLRTRAIVGRPNTAS